MSDFFVLDTNIAQSAQKNAAEIVAAEVAAGFHSATSDVDARFAVVADRFFSALKEQADSDNEKLAERQTKAPARKSGGGSGGGGQSANSADNVDAASLALKGGRFDGMTIEQVFEAPEGTNGYEKKGSEYVNWLASDNNKNTYTRKVAARFLEERKASVN